MAGIASDVFVQLNFFLNPVGDFFERKSDFYAQVSALANPLPTRTLPAKTTAAESATTKSTTESAAKDIAEMAEDVIHRHALSTETTGSAHTLVPELIVTASFLLIPQYLVSFGRFLRSE